MNTAKAIEEQILSRYTELFPNYAFSDTRCAVDLMAAEIVTLRKEAQEPACPHVRTSRDGTSYCELAQAAPSAVPEGYVLVPVEPTEEMIYACRYVLAGDRSGQIAGPIYRAMLAAAKGEGNV